MNTQPKEPKIYYSWNEASLLEIYMDVEYQNGIKKDIVFITITPHYKQEKKISMLLTIPDVGALYYACKELYQTKNTEYKKFTSSGNKQKILTLEYGNQKDVYSISINGNKVTFDKWKFLAFRDMLHHMMFRCLDKFIDKG